MKIRIRLGYVLIGATYLASICMILFKCWPLHKQWQIFPDPGSRTDRIPPPESLGT